MACFPHSTMVIRVFSQHQNKNAIGLFLIFITQDLVLEGVRRKIWTVSGKHNQQGLNLWSGSCCWQFNISSTRPCSIYPFMVSSCVLHPKYSVHPKWKTAAISWLWELCRLRKDCKQPKKLYLKDNWKTPMNRHWFIFWNCLLFLLSN